MNARPIGPARRLDLTAIAAEQRADEGPLWHAPDGQPYDVIVVDDQTDFAAGWFRAHLAGYRCLSFSGVDALERFLDGRPDPNLPEGPFRPILALVDLLLGAGERSGLSAILALRQSRAYADLPIVLNTNELTYERDLLAVACASANGGGILAAHKSNDDGPRVRMLADVLRMAADAGTPQPIQGPLAALPYVREVSVRSKTSRKTHDLLTLLLGEPWKRSFWKLFTFDYTVALAAALDRHPDAGTRREIGRSDFGELPVALELCGGAFHALRDGVLDLRAAVNLPYYRDASASRGELMFAFARRYGPALRSDEVQAYAASLAARR